MRLAEAHVVGEDAPGAERLEELEPRQAEALVGAKRRLEARRACPGSAATASARRRRAQAPRPRRPCGRRSPRSSDRAGRAGGPGGAPALAGHHLARFVRERLDRRRDARERAVAQRDPALLARERRADGVELHRELARRELEARVEPVALERDVNPPRSGAPTRTRARRSESWTSIAGSVAARRASEALLPERDGVLVGDGDSRSRRPRPRRRPSLVARPRGRAPPLRRCARARGRLEVESSSRPRSRRRRAG